MARLSINEREFVESALRQELRVDGRAPFDSRRTLINFAREDGAVEVQHGETRVFAVVSAQLVQPYPDRPNEGSFVIHTEFSPMADPSFEPGRPGELAIELGRVIDRGLRESKAVDTESLCVLAGKAVWSLRIDINILDNGGNLIDVANIAALAGLLSFRKPECSIGGADGQEVIVHPPEIREPLPLTLHHLPVAVTFGFFSDGELVVLDPSLKEEAVMRSRLTVTLNAHGEVCSIQKGGGAGVRTSELLRCMRIASAKAADIATVLKNGAERHELERAQRKIKRHQTAAETPKAIKVDEAGHRGRAEELKDVAMESDTDSAEEMQTDQQPAAGKGEEAFFRGGATSWNLNADPRPPDETALEELDRAATMTTTTKIERLVSAAAVYRANPELKSQKKEVGPVVFAKVESTTTTEIEMIEEQSQAKPTSLLDAVKKKAKKRKKPSSGK